MVTIYVECPTCGGNSLVEDGCPTCRTEHFVPVEDACAKIIQALNTTPLVITDGHLWGLNRDGLADAILAALGGSL